MINSCGFVGDAVAVDRTIFVIPHLRKLNSDLAGLPDLDFERFFRAWMLVPSKVAC